MADNETTIATAINVAVLQEKIAALEDRLTVSEKRTAALVQDRDNAVKWGLMTLGAGVLSMGSWIFHLLTNNITIAK